MFLSPLLRFLGIFCFNPVMDQLCINYRNENVSYSPEIPQDSPVSGLTMFTVHFPTKEHATQFHYFKETHRPNFDYTS